MTQQPNPEDIRAKINNQLETGDFTGWFETLYAGAQQNPDIIPWIHSTTHPLLVEWLDKNKLQGKGKRAIVLGSGLGDDAEKLAELGFRVTAFDISPSAIAWSKQRFPDTNVDYQVADLFNLPTEWHGQFDFILEIFTVQALPQSLREDAFGAIATLLKDGGQLLIVCWGREHHETPQGPPWAISKQELKILETQGLIIEHIEDFFVTEESTILEERDDDHLQNEASRRFRIVYRK